MRTIQRENFDCYLKVSLNNTQLEEESFNTLIKFIISSILAIIAKDPIKHAAFCSYSILESDNNQDVDTKDEDETEKQYLNDQLFILLRSESNNTVIMSDDALQKVNEQSVKEPANLVGAIELVRFKDNLSFLHTWCEQVNHKSLGGLFYVSESNEGFWKDYELVEQKATYVTNIVGDESFKLLGAMEEGFSLFSKTFDMKDLYRDVYKLVFLNGSSGQSDDTIN